MPPPDKPLTRREALSLLGGAALLTTVSACRSVPASAGARKPFRFIQVNDTHAMSPECPAWLDRVVARMREDAPAFCLLCGDLTDHAERAYLLAVRDAFARLGAPTYPVIGNHDYVTQTDRTTYLDVFPGRLNYQFTHGGWRFVGLDTTEGQKYDQTQIADDTLAWLDAHRARLAGAQPTVVFTHFPLADGVPMRPRNADAVFDRLAGVNLVAVFSGHHHGFTEHFRGRTSLTTDKCCALHRENHDGTRGKGYFLCEARADGTLQRDFIQVPA